MKKGNKKIKMFIKKKKEREKKHRIGEKKK